MRNKTPVPFQDLLRLMDKGNNVFESTGTSRLLAEVVADHVKNKKNLKVLDLGCGNGVIALYLKNRFKDFNIFASDVSEEAIALGKKNSMRLNLPVIFFKSNLFEAVAQGDKYDLIINDVSGISATLAKYSDWFAHVSCNSGENGITLTKKVLSQSAKFLNKDGGLVMPIISLSDSNQLMLEAQKFYSDIKVLAFQEWPVTAPQLKFISAARDLKSKGIVDFQEKFGKIIFSTKIISLHTKKED